MRARAFTVVETLIAIALLLMLSAALIAFLFDVQSTRERVSTLASERLAGALALDAMDEAARFAIARGEGGAGISGDRTSLRIATQSVDLDATEPEASSLGVARVRTLAWDEASGTMSLDDEEMTDRVRRLVIRYHDGDAWLDAFDSSQTGGLPVAIEIAIWFGEVEDQDDELGATLGDIDLGEGFGLPTPADLASARGPVSWGEPDRRRVIAVPALRRGDDG